MCKLSLMTVCLTLSLTTLWGQSPSNDTGTETTASGTDSQKTVQVTATGVGLTPESAEKAALANAVQQAVGMYLDSDTVVKNEQLLEDKILSVSDGFISHVDIKVPVRKRLSDGLFETTIVAVVEKNKVGSALRQANIIQSTTDGRDAWAQVVTKIQNAQDATEALKKHFAKLQVQLLTARLIPSKNESGADVVGPQVKPDPSTNTAICAWNIEVSYDRKAYYEQAFPLLEKCLGALADRRGQDMIIKSRIAVPQAWDRDLTSTAFSAFLNTPWRFQYDDNRPKENLEQGQFIVGLNVGGDRTRQNLRFETYILNTELYAKWLAGLQAPLCLRVVLLGADNKIIHDENVSLSRTLGYSPRQNGINDGLNFNQNPCKSVIHVNASEINIIRPRLGYMLDYNYPPSFWFTPDFESLDGVAVPSCNQFYSLMDDLIVHYEVSLDPSDIKDIKAVRFEFVPDSEQLNHG